MNLLGKIRIRDVTINQYTYYIPQILVSWFLYNYIANLFWFIIGPRGLMTSVLLLSILGIFTNSWGIFQIQLMISNSTGAQKHALRLLKFFVWPRIYSILGNVTSAPEKRSVKLVVNVVFFLSIFETCMLNYLAILGYLSQQLHKNLFEILIMFIKFQNYYVPQ